tara:strand:+ start:1640 stop:2164 length:525 start_codon:yes stop_codon:yes gene_type:complete
MGFFWSQPDVHAETLKSSLLRSGPELIFHAGDLLITPASALEITLNGDLWSRVAVVVRKDRQVYAFVNGVYEPVYQYLSNHPDTTCRPMHCIRHMGFDKRVAEAAERTEDLLMGRPDMSIQYREGFCAGTVLAIMGVIDLKTLSLHFDCLRPAHFAPGGRLDLNEYTTESWNVY